MELPQLDGSERLLPVELGSRSTCAWRSAWLASTARFQRWNAAYRGTQMPKRRASRLLLPEPARTRFLERYAQMPRREQWHDWVWYPARRAAQRGRSWRGPAAWNQPAQGRQWCRRRPRLRPGASVSCRATPPPAWHAHAPGNHRPRAARGRRAYPPCNLATPVGHRAAIVFTLEPAAALERLGERHAEPGQRLRVSRARLACRAPARPRTAGCHHPLTVRCMARGCRRFRYTARAARQQPADAPASPAAAAGAAAPPRPGAAAASHPASRGARRPSDLSHVQAEDSWVFSAASAPSCRHRQSALHRLGHRQCNASRRRAARLTYQNERLRTECGRGGQHLRLKHRAALRCGQRCEIGALFGCPRRALGDGFDVPSTVGLAPRAGPRRQGFSGRSDAREFRHRPRHLQRQPSPRWPRPRARSC